MSHRNNTACIVFIVVISCFASTPAFCNENPVIQFYQDHLSVVDGERCTMHPTCSAYAGQAIEKHGVVTGWIMALDRLIRCGRDEALISPSYVVNNQTIIYDPVEANDFWWFNKEQ